MFSVRSLKHSGGEINENRNLLVQWWNWIIPSLGMGTQILWDQVLDRIGDSTFHIYVYGIAYIKKES
jgi:hypothetical protein